MEEEKPPELSGELEFIKSALEAPTHEANDYNCEDWPPGEGCSGCEGDKLREEAIQHIEKVQLLLDQSKAETAREIKEELEKEFGDDAFKDSEFMHYLGGTYKQWQDFWDKFLKPKE